MKRQMKRQRDGWMVGRIDHRGMACWKDGRDRVVDGGRMDGWMDLMTQKLD